MKASKKIIGASCALVAAVALSAGSTFAWFTASGTVKATGMKVQAATAKNLVIRETSQTSAKWATVASTTGSGVQSLSPASNSNIKTATPTPSAFTPEFFYVSNPAGVDYATGAAGDGTVITKLTNTTKPTSSPSSGDVYVVEYSYDIKTEGSTSYTGLFVSDIQLTANSKAITHALRVGVVCGNYGYIYAPARNDSAYTYNGISAAGTVSSSTALSTASVTTTVASASSNAATLGAPSSTALTVKVYVWYEGQDPDCISANSLDVEQTEISISFSGITTS